MSGKGGRLLAVSSSGAPENGTSTVGPRTEGNCCWGAEPRKESSSDQRSDLAPARAKRLHRQAVAISASRPILAKAGHKAVASVRRLPSLKCYRLPASRESAHHMVFDPLFTDTDFGGDFAVGLAAQPMHQKNAARAAGHSEKRSP